MPSLFRVLFAVAVFCGLGYAALLALVTFVGPQTREITVTIPQDRFVKH